MNRISFKLLGILAIFLFVAVMPIVVLATNENISVVNSSENEYIIYIKDYTDKSFKYAFSNNADVNPKGMDLTYINSISDLRGNQAAFIDAKTYEKLLKENQPIFMWAKDEEENLILERVQLDFANSLTKENIDTVEKTTKRIAVEIAKTKTATDSTEPIREENVDGVKETAKVGYVKITDNKDATYYYQKVKTTDSAEIAKLMELSEKINKEYDVMDMYEKVQINEEFYNLYSKLVNEAEWQDATNMEIKQPETSVAGDKYIVFLKKVDSNQETTVDAQFLTAYDDYQPNVVKEQKVTQETTKLPITYDSIALFVILVVVVIALVVVFIRMKKLNKNEKK